MYEPYAYRFDLKGKRIKWNVVVPGSVQRLAAHKQRKEAVLRKELAKYKDGKGRMRKLAADRSRTFVFALAA